MNKSSWSENVKVRDHSKDISIDGKVILEWILGTGWESVKWVHLTQNKDQWRGFMNTIMCLRVRKRWKIS
jgi:hypothetical protein